MFSLETIQAALQSLDFDGWLLYDFRGANVLARRVLQMTGHVGSRRFMYWVPAQGSPLKLVHRIESGALDHLPGEKRVYLRWQEWEAGVASLVSGAGVVAMEYSTRCSNPYVARVDAGTVELVKACGPRVVSSGDLIQKFEATWTDAQRDLHNEASRRVLATFEHAWAYIAEQVKSQGSVREADVQGEILSFFAQQGLVADHAPIVGCGPHSGDPHYEPIAGQDAAIQAGDFVLLDIWAKLDQPLAVFADYTRVGFLGSEPTARHVEIFDIVAAARDAAIERVQQAFAKGEPLQGWQVDRAARDVIDAAGYGEFFVHRTGHSIGQETHGNGANMDDLETHDERGVLPGTCFSIEPGIYLPEFGVRSEINVYIDSEGGVHVTGDPQRAIHAVQV